MQLDEALLKLSHSNIFVKNDVTQQRGLSPLRYSANITGDDVFRADSDPSLLRKPQVSYNRLL